MEISTRESRRSPRVRLTTPVRMQVRGSNLFNRTIGENVSESGLCLVNSEFVAPLTPVMLEIEVLSKVLHPIGKVVWATPYARANRYRLGAEFIEIEPQEKKFLTDFVNMSR